MKASEYRERYEAGKTSRARAAGATAPSISSVTAAANPMARISAIQRMPFTDEDLGPQVELLLGTLGNREEPPAVRVAALRALEAIKFLGPRFDPYRSDYMAKLRQTATDPDIGLRAKSLEVLAIEKDGFAQGLLLDGLKNPAKALVPAAKAIQLLGYDVHVSAVPIVREYLEKSEDPAVIEEALRVLASDPASLKLFSDLLKNKSLPARLRSLSAAGLQNLDPESFEAAARQIVEDEAENPEVRATCLGALTHLRAYQKTRSDAGFQARVKDLESKTISPALRQSAERFLKSTQTDK